MQWGWVAVRGLSLITAQTNYFPFTPLFRANCSTERGGRRKEGWVRKEGNGLIKRERGQEGEMEVWNWQRESEDEMVCRSLKQKDQQGGEAEKRRGHWNLSWLRLCAGGVLVQGMIPFYPSYHLDLCGHPRVIACLILKDVMGSYEETELKSMAGLESEPLSAQCQKFLDDNFHVWGNQPSGSQMLSLLSYKIIIREAGTKESV